VTKAETVKPLTKTEIIANIVATTELPKKDVLAVFDALGEEIKKSFGKKGAKSFVLPGLIKIALKQVKAQPAKKGVKNSLTGEIYDRPAKPAHKKIRVRALKALKELV
jgi:nucleoid DNA-binding protein